MPKRKAHLYRSSEDGKRHLAVDKEAEAELIKFLGSIKGGIKKFEQVVDLILANIRNTDLYDKEEIDNKSKKVTAMKLFKGGQNARIYCKEQSSPAGDFIVIAAELLPKKKNQKVTNVEKAIIHRIAGYEYTIEERPASEDEA